MMFHEVLARNPRRASVLRQDEADAHLARAAAEIRGGAAWTVRRVLVAGQKPEKESDSESESESEAVSEAV